VSEHSPILRIIAYFAIPVSVLVAVRIFLQGHDEPGGGFIAGVLLVAAGAIYMMAFGTRRVARFPWWRLSVVGLLVSILTGTVPMLFGHAFMDHTVLHLGSFHLPSATFFDLGVMLVVLGALMTVFLELGAERR
jgi:multisubunit Na+/H+ antiporter MnhB subunit